MSGKWSDCGKNKIKVVNVCGQSYAIAAVTILTLGISCILGWKPVTLTDREVSETMNAFLPKAQVSACESSSQRAVPIAVVI